MEYMTALLISYTMTSAPPQWGEQYDTYILFDNASQCEAALRSMDVLHTIMVHAHDNSTMFACEQTTWATSSIRPKARPEEG